MKPTRTAQWPVMGSFRPQDAREHANALMKDFDMVNTWLVDNPNEFSNYSTRRFKKSLAFGVKQGVDLCLEDVLQGIHPEVDKESVKEVIEREIAKELPKTLVPGVPKVFFDQLYESYIELNRKLAANDGSSKAYNSRLHQRLPKRLPRAEISPCSSRNVPDKHTRQDGEHVLRSDYGGTRGWGSKPSEDSEDPSVISEEQQKGSSDRCCMCGTIASQEELTTTMCCSKFIGSICFEEALQETGKCCLCQRTHNTSESPKHSENSEHDQEYKFHFIDFQNQAEDYRKDKSIPDVANQSETGVAWPPWEETWPSLAPRKSAKPLECLGESSEWTAGKESFSNLWPEPSKDSYEDSSTHGRAQRLHLPEDDRRNSSITKEYEFVFRLSDQAVISHLKSLSRDDVWVTFSEALEQRLSTTIHTTSILGVLLLESGDIQFRYRAKKSRGPDLERVAVSLAETLKICVRARLKPYLVVMHNIEIKSMNLCNKVQRTRVIEELVRSNTSFMQYLSRPEDIRTICWTTNKEKRLDVQVDSVTLGLATAAQANKIIAGGLSWKGIRRCCVKHVPKHKFVQCYNCQNFGHIGKTCTSSPRCRVCAGCHQSTKCPLGLNASPKSLKCALCGGPHCANDYYCPVRSGEEIRLQTESRFYPTDADNGPAASAIIEADSFQMPLPDTTPLPATPSSQVSKSQLYSKVGDKAPIAEQRAPFVAFDPVWQFDLPLKPIDVKPIVNLPKLPSHSVSNPTW